MIIAYLLTCITNSKRYVGITRRKLRTRWRRHCLDAVQGSELLLHRAIRKYGVESFNVETLQTFETWKSACDAEKLFIIKNETFVGDHPHKGYNMTRGGDGACGYHFSDEKKRAMSLRTSGKNNPFYGKKHTKETLTRMSKSHKEHIMSDEARAAIARGNQGKNTGKKHSIESRRKMSIARKKPVVQMTLNDDIIKVHDSALDTESATGVKRQHIYRCCIGLRKSSGGFKWKYV